MDTVVATQNVVKKPLLSRLFCDGLEIFGEHGIAVNRANRRLDLPAAAFGGGDGFAAFGVVEFAHDDFAVAAWLDDFDAVAAFASMVASPVSAS